LYETPLQLLVMIIRLFFVHLFLLFVSYSQSQNFSLCQNWKMKAEDDTAWIGATVPGNVHFDLLHAKKIPDPFYGINEKLLEWIEFKNWLYISEFEVNDNILKSENIDLVFEGLDTYATVFLNGYQVLKTDNMFRTWKTNVKPYLKVGTKNTLLIKFESPVMKGLEILSKLPYAVPSMNDKKKTCPLTRKAPYHYGWDWGPRLVTSGIWRPVYLHVWNAAKIDNVQIISKLEGKDKAHLTCNIEIDATQDIAGEIDVQYKGSLGVRKKVMVKKGIGIYTIDLVIDKPMLWYPTGYGKQPIYEFYVSLKKGKTILAQDTVKTGIRKLELVQQKDSIGRSFYFKVNDIPIFAKGANSIPFDNLLNRVTKSTYKNILQAAKDCNMNMIRTWGGGIYEENVFYELCDSLGIMLWQDFMFGNELYYADSAFMKSIEEELIYNLKRLRNHPSIVLWCGDNEQEWGWKQWGWYKKYDARLWDDYVKMTQQLFPSLCKQYDTTRTYWRSSPNSGSDSNEPNDPRFGDIHDWRIHFGPPPFERYEQLKARFVSEFGHQGFPDWKTILSFTDSTDRSTEFINEQLMKSVVLRVHNKQPWGNNKIKGYMNYYYKVPTDFRKYSELSQICQAEGLKTGVEHHRRSMPTTMGSLYWQLNDCWPVTSWSSIDYFGRWKALQYYSRKFFAPILVSPHLLGDSINIYVVSDSVHTVPATLSLKIIDFEGNMIWQQTSDIQIKGLSSTLVSTYKKSEILAGKDLKNALIYCQLSAGGQVVSKNTVYFSKMKDCVLPKSKIEKSVTEENGVFKIMLNSSKLVRNVVLYNDEVEGNFSDNYFDILPGQTLFVKFTPNKKLTKEEFEKKLKTTSLVEIME